MLYPARSILAIDVSPFGRSLDLFRAINAVREVYPATFLVVAATTGACELIAAANLADETIDLGVIKASVGNASRLRILLTLARRSRRYSFDLILDFSPRLETAIVSTLLLRTRTITPTSIPRAIEFFLGRNLKSDDYASVLKQIGTKFQRSFQFAPSTEEDSRFEQFLASNGSRGGELIVLLYATSAHVNRSWNLESLAETGTRLANNLGARIVAADQPADSEFTDAIKRLLPAGSSMLTEPRAPLLIAALARASLVVTDDAAIARLAAGMSTPVIEIRGSLTDQNPSSKRHRVVQTIRGSLVSTDEIYEIACEMIQESRSNSLFDRP